MKKERKERITNFPFSKDKFDPMGCYTGRAWDPYDEPVQDADDL